jgi:hypothetical protein
MDQPRARIPANPQKGKTKVRHLQLTHLVVSFHAEEERRVPDASSPGRPLIKAGFTPSHLAGYDCGKCTAPLTALSHTGWVEWSNRQNLHHLHLQFLAERLIIGQLDDATPTARQGCDGAGRGKLLQTA